MQIEPNNAKHQEIIFNVCKNHGVKSLELTTRHISLMDDCIEEYIRQKQTSHQNENTTNAAEGQDFELLYKQAIELLDPIIDWGQNQKNIPLGGSITFIVLQRAKQFDDAKKALEAMINAYDRLSMYQKDWFGVKPKQIQQIKELLSSWKELVKEESAQTEPVVDEDYAARKLKLLALKIENRIKELGLQRNEFAALMEVQPSIVTRWLSGEHNFTLNTLFEIERRLEFPLFNYTIDGKEAGV